MQMTKWNCHQFCQKIGVVLLFSLRLIAVKGYYNYIHSMLTSFVSTAIQEALVLCATIFYSTALHGSMFYIVFMPEKPKKQLRNIATTKTINQAHFA